MMDIRTFTKATKKVSNEKIAKSSWMQDIDISQKDTEVYCSRKL